MHANIYHVDTGVNEGRRMKERCKRMKGREYVYKYIS